MNTLNPHPAMFEIRAVIRPNKLAKLREALRGIPNFPGVTVSQAEGFTAPAAIGKRTVKAELTDFSDRLVVSVIAQSDMVPVIREAIITAACTGQIGDGLVWTLAIGDIHRIRDGSDLRPS
jgi:nitrogen regulatory protein P-II 1